MTEEEVFLAALDLADPGARGEYLERTCRGDAAFRQQVEELLAAHFKEGAFLDEPIGAQMGDGRLPVDADSLVTRVANRGGGTDKNPAAEEPCDLSFLLPPTRTDSLGRIGHYEVLQILGRGGFGIVFRAFDDVLHRVVALKVLAPALAATSPARKRFLREARSFAQVRHENVVQIYAIEERPLPYLVMEYIPGETLQQRLDRTGPLEESEIVRFGRQMAEGLAAAHATGLIHRDVTPGNVLIEAGPQERAKITDFGLARAADDASISQSGVVAGTPLYMAPEQARGEPLDYRADLFSLGSVLYTLATGRPPFRAAATFAVLKRVIEDAPRPVRDVIPEAPQWLADVIAKLHAKNPDDRFQSAGEVAAALADGAPSEGARPRRSRSALGRSGRRKWVVVAALLLSVFVLALAESTGLTHWLQRPRAASDSVKNGAEGDGPPNPNPPEFTNTLGMKFNRIPLGRFRMGSPAEEVDRCLNEFAEGSTKFQALRKKHEGKFEEERLPAEAPAHEVAIARSFYMGATEVTAGQFRRFVEEKGYSAGDEGWKVPGLDEPDNCPVTYVSWYNAVDFCTWLSAKEGKTYRLPTEAEWEYCCRAGKSGARYCFGDDDDQLEHYAWYDKNSTRGEGTLNRTNRVARLKSNAWGLYDMHGNAWEWCQDSYDPNYYKNSPMNDPSGGAGASRVLRGGSWYWAPEFCRSAFRHYVPPDLRYYDVGFRVVLVPK